MSALLAFFNDTKSETTEGLAPYDNTKGLALPTDILTCGHCCRSESSHGRPKDVLRGSALIPRHAHFVGQCVD